MEKEQDYTVPLGGFAMLFLIFGFITSLNSVLVPYLQGVFSLAKWESNLVNSAFFLAYFVMSVPAAMVIKKAGYKRGCVIGLIICAAGAFLYYPSGSMQSFALFIFTTFVIATGVVVLQVAANPFVTLLGPPETAAGRLTMTQAFNSLGTYGAPLAANVLILKAITDTMTSSDKAKAVQVPYLELGGLLIVLALVFSIFKLPDPDKEKKDAKGVAAQDNFDKLHSSAWGYRHLVLGVFGIFAYVGVEVTVGSNITFYLKEALGMSTSSAAPFVALYWGGAMIGRFFFPLTLMKTGSAARKYGLAALVAAFAFFVGWYADKNPIQGMIFFGIAVANYLAFRLGRKSDRGTLALFAGIAAVLSVAPMVMGNGSTIWTLVAIGFFNSLMFPTIFSLAIAKLGRHTVQGSGAVNVGIVGGAIVPPIWGYVADITHSVTTPFLVCAICYAYIAFFALRGSIPEKAPVPAKAVK
jgi:MFS transporter, FHS family, L-fucose permease